MPGAVRRKDDFFDEVRQQDGTWASRLRTTATVTLPDGSTTTKNIPLEELQQQAYKREEIEGTVRIRRLDPYENRLVWDEYDKIDTEKQQVEREKLENIKLNSEADVTKQVYTDYQSFIGDREEDLFGDEGVEVAPQMNMIEWLNSPNGALSRRLLERHGIELDGLTSQPIDPLGMMGPDTGGDLQQAQLDARVHHDSPMLSVMGEGPPVPASVAAFNTLKELGEIPEDAEFDEFLADRRAAREHQVDAEGQPQPEPAHPDVVSEVRPRDNQGRIVPPTTELADGTQISYQPHDSTEAETPSEFNDSWENWSINFENWYRGLNDKQFGEKDGLGNTYELGTIVRSSFELGGQPEDVPITPMVIENVLREGGLEKDRIEYLIKLAKWRFKEHYGETWEDWSTDKGMPVAN